MPDEAPALVEVTRAGSLMEARLIVGLLESYGIPAHIPGASMLEMYDGAAAIWSGGVSVEVPRDRAEEARELLLDRSPEGDDEEELEP
jgi:hypothetical protein